MKKARRLDRARRLALGKEVAAEKYFRGREGTRQMTNTNTISIQYGLVTDAGRFIVIGENITWLQLIGSQVTFALMTIVAVFDILRGVVYNRPRSYYDSVIIGKAPKQEQWWQIAKIWLRHWLIGVLELALR